METVVLAFGVLLVVAVLFSERAQRTVLSASVLFLVAGVALGNGGLGWLKVVEQPKVVGMFAELALFAILFVDGTQLPLSKIREAWRLPGRALLVGMPLTIAGIAVAARLFLGLTWTEAFLVGAILSPTDPVFVAAILEREAVPLRLRRLLSVESGVNDGLALPIVMVLLAVAGHRSPHPLRALADAGGGIAVGFVVPAAFLWLEGRRFFAAAAGYRPLAGMAIGALLLGLTRSLGLNEFLAAFTAGIAFASRGPTFAEAVRSLGAPLAEALKLATLLVFGTVLTVPGLLAPGWSGLAFALIALLAARPLALVLAFIGRPLSTKEWLAAGWFGPKGFASLLYALLLGQAGLAAGDRMLHAIALVIVLSIVAHSSTDVAVARVFRAEERKEQRA